MKRKNYLNPVKFKSPKQGELAYVESRIWDEGVWCQKLPLNDSEGKTTDVYYIPVQTTYMFEKIKAKNLERPQINFKSDFVITKILRSGEIISRFIINNFNEECPYIEHLTEDKEDFLEFKKYIDKNTGFYRMFRIYERNLKKTITCKSCTKRGEVLRNCAECGGKGVRNKSYKAWDVKNYMYDCYKIDRDKDTKLLRFWDAHDSNCYFEENTRVFFEKEDAIKKCMELNNDIKE